MRLRGPLSFIYGPQYSACSCALQHFLVHCIKPCAGAINQEAEKQGVSGASEWTIAARRFY
jgi:hypothetical protein